MARNRYLQALTTRKQEIMKGKYEIAVALTILSFILPVFYYILKRKALNPFSLSQLTKCFNFALTVQISLAGLYLGTMWLIDKKLYTKGQSNDLTDILMEIGITYTIVGAFFYLPGLILFNIISFFITRLRTK